MFIELQGSAKTRLGRKSLEVCILNISIFQLLMSTTGRRIDYWTAAATSASDVWAGVSIIIIPSKR